MTPDRSEARRKSEICDMWYDSVRPSTCNWCCPVYSRGLGSRVTRPCTAETSQCQNKFASLVGLGLVHYSCMSLLSTWLPTEQANNGNIFNLILSSGSILALAFLITSRLPQARHLCDWHATSEQNIWISPFEALGGMHPFRPSPYNRVVVVAVSGFSDCGEDESSLAAPNGRRPMQHNEDKSPKCLSICSQMLPKRKDNQLTDDIVCMA
jgi:hypothetical protein